uniref:Uncharacterized protein n=1 Tax=Sus scrofa TaxID=9823 RepID=A0A4X1UQ14_PIG
LLSRNSLLKTENSPDVSSCKIDFGTSVRPQRVLWLLRALERSRTQALPSGGSRPISRSHYSRPQEALDGGAPSLSSLTGKLGIQTVPASQGFVWMKREQRCLQSKTQSHLPLQALASCTKGWEAHPPPGLQNCFPSTASAGPAWQNKHDGGWCEGRSIFAKEVLLLSHAANEETEAQRGIRMESGLDHDTELAPSLLGHYMQQPHQQVWFVPPFSFLTLLPASMCSGADVHMTSSDLAAYSRQARKSVFLLPIYFESPSTAAGAGDTVVGSLGKTVQSGLNLGLRDSGGREEAKQDKWSASRDAASILEEGPFLSESSLDAHDIQKSQRHRAHQQSVESYLEMLLCATSHAFPSLSSIAKFKLLLLQEASTALQAEGPWLPPTSPQASGTYLQQLHEGAQLLHCAPEVAPMARLISLVFGVKGITHTHTHIRHSKIIPTMHTGTWTFKDAVGSLIFTLGSTDILQSRIKDIRPQIIPPLSRMGGKLIVVLLSQKKSLNQLFYAKYLEPSQENEETKVKGGEVTCPSLNEVPDVNKRYEPGRGNNPNVKMWYIYTMNDIMPFAATWMELENLILNTHVATEDNLTPCCTVGKGTFPPQVKRLKPKDKMVKSTGTEALCEAIQMILSSLEGFPDHPGPWNSASSSVKEVDPLCLIGCCKDPSRPVVPRFVCSQLSVTPVLISGTQAATDRSVALMCQPLMNPGETLTTLDNQEYSRRAGKEEGIENEYLRSVFRRLRTMALQKKTEKHRFLPGQCSDHIQQRDWVAKVREPNNHRPPFSPAGCPYYVVLTQSKVPLELSRIAVLTDGIFGTVTNARLLGHGVSHSVSKFIKLFPLWNGKGVQIGKAGSAVLQGPPIKTIFMTTASRILPGFASLPPSTVKPAESLWLLHPAGQPDPSPAEAGQGHGLAAEVQGLSLNFTMLPVGGSLAAMDHGKNSSLFSPPVKHWTSMGQKFLLLQLLAFEYKAKNMHGAHTVHPALVSRQLFLCTILLIFTMAPQMVGGTLGSKSQGCTLDLGTQEIPGTGISALWWGHQCSSPPEGRMRFQTHFGKFVNEADIIDSKMYQELSHFSEKESEAKRVNVWWVSGAEDRARVRSSVNNNRYGPAWWGCLRYSRETETQRDGVAYLKSPSCVTLNSATHTPTSCNLSLAGQG